MDKIEQEALRFADYLWNDSDFNPDNIVAVSCSEEKILVTTKKKIKDFPTEWEGFPVEQTVGTIKPIVN